MKRLFAILLFTVSANAMTVADYIASLERLRNEPRDAAAIDAKALIGVQVDAFTADPSLLDAVINKRDDAVPRLDAAIAALKTSNPGTASQKVDAKLLEHLRAEEKITELQRGGEVVTTPDANATPLERIAKTLEKFFNWLGEKLEKFWDWLAKFWPEMPRRDRSKPYGGMPFVVTAIAIAIVAVLIIVALEVLRRSKKGKAEEVATSDPITSRRDEDPLSRGSSEWERYAAQLAAAGRIREAIRAWYHAVLVTCYGAGILTFRKGRTNWEYVSMMRADVNWRPQFADLTRQYEREWYGRAESTYEALDDCSRRAQSILDHIHRRSAA